VHEVPNSWHHLSKERSAMMLNLKVRHRDDHDQCMASEGIEVFVEFSICDHHIRRYAELITIPGDGRGGALPPASARIPEAPPGRSHIGIKRNKKQAATESC